MFMQLIIYKCSLFQNIYKNLIAPAGGNSVHGCMVHKWNVKNPSFKQRSIIECLWPGKKWIPTLNELPRLEVFTDDYSIISSSFPTINAVLLRLPPICLNRFLQLPQGPHSSLQILFRRSRAISGPVNMKSASTQSSRSGSAVSVRLSFSAHKHRLIKSDSTWSSCFSASGF